MTTFFEALPERKSSKHGAIQWVPAEVGSPVAGQLLIDTKRARVVYSVAEFPTDWAGRAFHLVKVTEGTDAESESYCVFCGSGPQPGDQCDCKGWTYSKTCKHVDACRALIENQWL